MKIDRFVKSVLVLIALFLALGCVNDLNLPSNSVEAAAPPSFLQVGKRYLANKEEVMVLEISNTGWVKVRMVQYGNSVAWMNPSAIVTIIPL